MSQGPLGQRFEEFLRGLAHSESLDDDTSIKGKKADFLVFDRRLIVEIKVLESDPSYKVDKITEALRDRPEFPLFYGERPVGKVLEHFPDAELILREIVDKATKQVMGALENADDQIGATRALFGLNKAEGVVYILNDKIPLLDPNHIASAVIRMLRKRKGRRLRYRSIGFVVVISEIHRIETSVCEDNLPILEMEGPSAGRFPKSNELISELSRLWSVYNGATAYLTGTVSGVDQLNFCERLSKPMETASTMKRHEYWRAQYRAARYLAALPEDDFWRHTAAIFQRMTPHFLKDRENLPEHEIRDLLMRWTHCLEECELRNLDMRVLDRYLDRSGW